LHVLSLPLAFILSQDQTLRCIYKKFNIFRSVFFLSLRNQQSWYTLLLFYFFLLVLQNVNELFHKKSAPLFLSPNADHHVLNYFTGFFSSSTSLPVAYPYYGAAKVITFSFLPKLFPKFYRKSLIVSIPTYLINNFSKYL
jgi:hypothetical protein